MSLQSASSGIDSCTNKCRACMKEGGNMLPMYDDNIISKINLPYKLAQLTSIEIDRFDGLTNMLCPKCAYRTNVFYNFRLEVQESDRKLRMMRETQMCALKEEELNDKNEGCTLQKDGSLKLEMSNNVQSVHNAAFEYVNIEMKDEKIKDEQQSKFNVSQLVENDKDSKESLQLNNLFYNIIQETNEGEMGVQLMKTELPEEISEMLTSQDVTIMYISKSAIESMSEENTLILEPEQEETENDNNIFISQMENLNGQENEKASSNICISSPKSNATRKNKYVYWKPQDATMISVSEEEQCDNTIQNKDEEAKLDESSSNIKQSIRTEESDGSDSDYFVDGKDNILGSVSDAIIRIKEVQQENGIEYQCTLCLQNYDQLTNVLLHTVENHVPLGGPFFCMVCEKDCKSHRELRMHVKTHTGQFPYSCFLCKKAYTRKRYLKRHMACHPNFSRHRCLKCGCRFKSKSELETHAATHEHVAPYACNQCTRVFNHKGNYKRHLISHLDPHGLHLPKYPCNYCGKRFPNNRTLQTHIRVHTGEKPFQCDICHKKFSQRGNLLNHSKIHSNPRSYTCEVCGRSFNQRATLRDHGLLHTGEKPHVCNVCGKAFTVSAALRRHMFNHAEGKPFQCENCGMGFVGKYDLRRHMRVHEDRPRERRRKNPKTNNSLQLKSEESHVALEEPDIETVLIEVQEEEEGLSQQNVTQSMLQVESEKENEDALFNLQPYNPVLYNTADTRS